ncbi:MAG: transposase [Candidatus Marsarchaeota archaeon]|nr:transposase [Candidatus Marsarchaeota archaeon]
MSAYRLRIYPDEKRRLEINERITIAKDFYNLLLEKSIAQYKIDGEPTSMAALNKYAKEIEKDGRFLILYSQTRCEIKYRVMKAYQNFFRRCKEKKKGKRVKVGFPRFKSRDKYKTIIYPQDNGSFSIEKERKTDMLRIARIGRMKIDVHRNIEGTIKTLTIKKELNQYYAIFTVVQETSQPKIQGTNPIGIDMGLNNFIALSDGTTIQKPRFFKKRERRIAIWQRRLSKRTRWDGNKMAKMQSKRREKAKLRLQREWVLTTNESNDFMHKLSNKLVNSGYTSFAVESLNIQNMERNHNLAQSIQNASWNRFINYLSYKAESAGMEVMKVDARNTSKTCSNCGNIQEMPLSIREYICHKCGLRIDRDINASINILKRGLTSKKSNLESEALKGRAGLARTYAQGDNVRLNGAVVEELRTYSQTNNLGGSLGLYSSSERNYCLV